MKKILATVLTILLFFNSPLLLAQNKDSGTGGGSGTIINGVSQQGNIELKSLLKNVFTETLKYMYFSKNAYLQPFSLNLGQLSSSLGEATVLAAAATQNKTTNLINEELAGYQIPGTPARAKPYTAVNSNIILSPSDELVKGTGSIHPSSFFFSAQNLQPPETDNNVLNAASLLVPDNYCAQGACGNSKAFYDALAFLHHAQQLAPTPPVIRIVANKPFDIPLTNRTNPMRSYASLRKVNYDTAGKLLAAVNTQPEFRDYKKKYRSYMALRSAYLNNLYHIFYEHKALCKTETTNGQCISYQFGGKSITQLKDELVNNHLNPHYVTSLQTATPATLARQEVMLLATISSQLNDLYKQNQRLLLTNSLSGLSSLTTTAQSIDSRARHAGAIVVQKYCALTHAKDRSNRDKNIKNCIKNYGAAPLTATTPGA